MHDLFNLGGRTALVTGANTGLGQGIAIALAEAGADIVAVGRSPATETGARVETLGRRFLDVRADLSSTQPVRDAVDAAIRLNGRLDIVVNNAGIIRRADSLDVEEADWDAVVDTNLKSVFFLAQAAARHMAAHGGGKIVNIASLLSFQGGVNVAAYTASKHAIAGLTKSLANEWAPHGVNVNAVAPGYVVTNNTEALRHQPERERSIRERIPAGRWADPQDIAGAVVFLTSPAACYVHGHVLVVDGGWMGR
jgi:2-deoxy-D-gluconate 3-dehydrogenase